MPNSRIFIDIHHNQAARPVVSGDDLYIDEISTGLLNPSLAALPGWASVPSGIRAGWGTRSGSTTDLNLLTLPLDLNQVPGVSSFGGRIAIAVIPGSIYYKDSIEEGWNLAEISPAATISSLSRIKIISSSLAYCVTALASSVEVLKSVDNCQTWQHISPPASGTFNSAFDASGTNIVLGCKFYSTDSGETWSAYTVSGTIYDCTISSTGSWFAATSVGEVYKSITNGASWTTAYTSSYNIQVLFSNGSEIVALVAAYPYQVLYSSNNGASWQLRSAFKTGLRAASIVYDGVNYYVSGDSFLLKGGDLSALDDTEITFTRIMKSLALYGAGVISTTSAAGFLGFYPSGNLKVGGGNCRRIGWIEIEKPLGYKPIVIDSSSLSLIEVNTKLSQGSSGAGRFYFFFPFVDNNGFPIEVTANIGEGNVQYIGWAIEYSMSGANIVATKIVGIKPFSYGASPVETTETSIYEALSLPLSPSVSLGKYSCMRIMRYALKLQSNTYEELSVYPDYNNIISRVEYAMYSSLISFIFDNKFGKGFLGYGGVGTTDGVGAIDNYSLRVF